MTNPGPVPAPLPTKVYRQSLLEVLVVHGALCFVGIGIITLPFGLVRWFRTSVQITEREVILKTGTLSTTRNDIPLARVDSVRLERPAWQRVFGAGVLIVSAGGGDPIKVGSLRGVEDARRVLQDRADTARRR